VASRRGAIEKALRDGSLSTKSLVENYCYIYKDSPDGSAVLGYGRSGVTGAEDRKEQYTVATLVSLEEDRVGDTVHPMGAYLGNYQRNPVWFFGHQEWQIPVGKAMSPDGRLCCFPEENRMQQWCWWDMVDPDAAFLKGKVDRGFVNATSVAFVPIEAQRKERVKAHQHQGDIGGYDFIRWDETEGSWVGVPSNPFATVQPKWYKSAPAELKDWCRDCHDKMCEWRDIADKEHGHISNRMEKCIRGTCAIKSTNESGGCFTGWCPMPKQQQIKSREVTRKSCGCSACSKGDACPCGKAKALWKRHKALVQADMDHGRGEGEIDMTKAQPSEEITSSDACQILRDGEANGQPLTEAQRGMFGAACGKKSLLRRVGKGYIATYRTKQGPIHVAHRADGRAVAKGSMARVTKVLKAGVDPCKRCKGRGWVRSGNGEMIECTACGGTGREKALRKDYGSKEYREGFAAGKRGKSSGDCPYDPHTPAGKDWLNGLDDGSGGKAKGLVQKNRYRLVSSKGTKTVNGSEQQAIVAAIKMEEELQPSFGVSIENEHGETIAEVNDGKVEKSLGETSGASGGYIAQKSGLGSKWLDLKAGKRVTMSDGEYDQLVDWLYDKPEDSEDYKLGGYLASVPNPRQIGTKDTLQVWLKKSFNRRKDMDTQYDQGYVAAWDGRARSTNPYKNDNEGRGPQYREDWDAGWVDGAKERLAGRKNMKTRVQKESVDDGAEVQSDDPAPMDVAPHEVAMAHLYQSAKSDRDYLTEALKDITPFDPQTGAENKAHKALTEHLASLGERAESLKAMFGEHSEKDIEEVGKGLSDTTNEEVGEANLVDRGEIPEVDMDLGGEVDMEEDDALQADLEGEEDKSEIGSPEWAAEEAAEPEHQGALGDEAEESDPSTEEILERYQNEKGRWGTRKASAAKVAKVLAAGGVVKSGSDGRKWLVLPRHAQKALDTAFKAGYVAGYGGKIHNNPYKNGTREFQDYNTGYEDGHDDKKIGKSPAYKSLRRKSSVSDPGNLDSGKGAMGDLHDEGNPAELKEEHAETIKSVSAAMKGMAVAHDMPEHHKSALDMHGDALAKGLEDGTHEAAMGKALDHMQSLKGAPDVPEHHKDALSYNAKRLKKALNDMGNPEETKEDEPEEEKEEAGAETEQKAEESTNEEQKALFDMLRDSAMELETTVKRVGLNGSRR